jgi:hypothetical protein
MEMVMALEQELATFESMKAELIKNHDGKFALIKGTEFFGSFDTPTNAYQEGINQFGKDLFLVKRISESEEVYRNSGGVGRRTLKGTILNESNISF